MDRASISTIATLLALILAAPATAETYSIYDCKFVISGGGGEVSEMLFVIDASGHAFTYDTKPGSDRLVLVPVSLRKTGKDELIFAYSLDVPNPERRLTIDMQARVPKAGGKSRISMTGRGFSGNPKGNGTCTLHQTKRLPG